MNKRYIVWSLVTFSAVMCNALTAEGLALKNSLQLNACIGPTNVYNWCPPMNVTLSNVVYNVTSCRMIDTGSYSFKLASQNNEMIASCSVAVGSSFSGALDMLCDHLVYGASIEIGIFVRQLSVRRDAVQNVIVARNHMSSSAKRGVSKVISTYGNLCVTIDVNTNQVPISAESFISPIALGGM